MAPTNYSIRAMPVGAEVIGLPAGSEGDPAVQRALYDAWLEHGILLFRGVDTIDRHLAISRCFGELEIHPVPEVRYPQNKYLIELGAPANGGRRKPVPHVYDE